jgi:hypothetical protein
MPYKKFICNITSQYISDNNKYGYVHIEYNDLRIEICIGNIEFIEETDSTIKYANEEGIRDIIAREKAYDEDFDWP